MDVYFRHYVRPEKTTTGQLKTINFCWLQHEDLFRNGLMKKSLAMP